MSEMQIYQSMKRVRAAEIVAVGAEGCLLDMGGEREFRAFEPGMTVRYFPRVGDFWVIYDDSYQSISPRAPFLAGYVAISPAGMPIV